jgi:peptide/nickel transport system substrate-binding protein
VTCADVSFTHRAQLDEGLAWSGAFLKERIGEVACPDPHTVVFRFTAAYSGQLMDANDDAIVPAAYGDVPFAEWAGTVWQERLVTCGPFRLERVTPGQEAILVRDPDWWAAADTNPDRVVLRVYPESSGALPAFLEGEVDLVLKVPPLGAAEVDARRGLRLVRLPSLSYTYLGWNMLEPEAYLRDRRARGCTGASDCRDSPEDLARLRADHPHPMLADPRVRRALTLAIDRKDLVDGLWSGHARVGTSPVVSALWAHDPSTMRAFDPGSAEALLDEAGWLRRESDGFRERDGRVLELRVIVNAGNRVRRDVLDRIAPGLARIGVHLIPEPLPRREFVSRARNKSFDVVISGWWAGTRIEPDNLLHSRSAVNRGNNLISWSTAESDALLDQAARAVSRDEALPLWQAWQAVYRAEQPLTILYEETRLLGLGPRVRGPEPVFLNPFQNLHRWWVEAEARPGS